VDWSGVIRRRLVVRGVVQGVGYRFSAARAAALRDVSGWIRNRSDGAVEAVLEGRPDAVESMVDWCRRGPPGALVEDVEVHEETPEGISGFSAS
jgi:acylphosphatase